MGAHAVIVAAGAGGAYEDAIPMLRELGTLVCVGLPADDYALHIAPFKLISRGRYLWNGAIATTNYMQV